MHISRLALDHFRSWNHCVVDFELGINIIQGRNGLGKTNLVEAIEVLSTGASHRTGNMRAVIERGQHQATIRANVHGDDVVETDEVTTYEVTLAARGANRARVNGGASLYMRDVVGRVPSVMFAPEDQRLISGEPATRRTFMNQAGAQLLAQYAAVAQEFSQIAKQRAALLKQLFEGAPGEHDAAMNGLEAWTGQFIHAGLHLTRMRLGLCESLGPGFTEIYDALSGSPQHAEISYQPSFDEIRGGGDVVEEISRHFQRIYPGELARGQNLIGPHRDDVNVLLDGIPAREYASNGEMWTLAIALKMALYRLLCKQLDVKPIIILDDVFAQLDEVRRAQILEFAQEQDQVIITAAAERDIPPITDATRVNVAALREENNSASASLDINPSVQGSRESV